MQLTGLHLQSTPRRISCWENKLFCIVKKWGWNWCVEPARDKESELKLWEEEGNERKSRLEESAFFHLLFPPTASLFPTQASSHPSPPVLLGCSRLSPNLLFPYIMQPVLPAIYSCVIPLQVDTPSSRCCNKLLITVALYPRRLVFKFSYSFLFNHSTCSS